MKSLVFKKLTLENFLSIGATPLELDFSNGLNLITGFNRDNPDEKNGIGKSSIADGLYFSLYNETIKDLKMSEIVNDKNKKKCKASIEFSIVEDGNTTEYVITRSIKPSNCLLMVNGNDKSLSSIPKTNKAIEDILGVSKELFKQSIIMSIGKSQSFFSQGKIDKRKFIEGIFNLEIFSDMLSDSRSGFNDAKREKDNLQIQLSSENGRLEGYIEKDASFEVSKQEYINLLVEQMQDDLKKAKKLKDGIQDEVSTKALDEALTALDARLSNINALNLQVEVKSSETNTKIRTLEDEITSCLDYCDKCNRKYDDAENIAVVQAKRKIELANNITARDTNQVNLKAIRDKRNSIDADRDKIKLQIGNINGIVNHNKTIHAHITTLQTSCVNHNIKIDAKRLESSNFSDLIDTSKTSIIELELDHKESVKIHKVYDICKFILSEEGVKSVIIRQLKNLLNSKMNYYLDELGSSVTCEFDEYFTETIYNKNGVEKSYDAFSGGESKRIDLAILLTFQDILKDQSGLDIQLGFYDEILDSSIDEIGRKKVLRILKDKSEHCPIYVISHRGKMSDLIDKEIVLEKHNDFTFIQDN